MKKIAFIGRQKLLYQGMEAVLRMHPGLELQLLPQLFPQNALLDVEIYQPDVAVIDVEMEKEALFALCRELHRVLPFCRRLLLVSDTESSLCIEARREGYAEDFVYTDSSMHFLLAKLQAL